MHLEGGRLMYIPEFWAGALLTIFAEIVAVLVAAYIMGKKKK
jgi:hypothetical protein